MKLDREIIKQLMLVYINGGNIIHYSPSEHIILTEKQEEFLLKEGLLEYKYLGVRGKRLDISEKGEQFLLKIPLEKRAELSAEISLSKEPISGQNLVYIAEYLILMSIDKFPSFLTHKDKWLRKVAQEIYDQRIKY